MASGGSSKPQTQQVNNDPWEPAQEYLLDIYGRAQNQFGASQNNKPVQQGLGAYGQQLVNTAQGDYLKPESNPFLGAIMQDNASNLTRQWQQQILPSIQSGAQQQGAYGGSRQGVVEALSAEALGRQIAQGNNALSLSNYNTERGNQLNSISGLQALQGADWGNLQNYANIVYGQGAGGTTTQTGTPGGGGVGGFFQGALGGAGLGGSLGSGNPYAILGGGLLGGLGGLF